MATSLTWAFTLDLPEIIEQAWEKAGEELRSGWDYRTARISLDLLMLEWQNRGYNLWTVKNANQALTAGTGTYALAAERLDIVEAVVRTDSGDVDAQADITLKRVSVSDWSRQTNKLTQGRPNQYVVLRDPAQITVELWPVPDSTQTYTLNYWYIERIEDAGTDGSKNIDVPARFLPALISGLACQLAMKRPALVSRVDMLRNEYEEQWRLAADASRDKASFFVQPYIGRV